MLSRIDVMKAVSTERQGQSQSEGTATSNHPRLIRDISIQENATIDEALRVMTEKGLKRLPVVDEGGHFRGMIRRDALLITLSHDL